MKIARILICFTFLFVFTVFTFGQNSQTPAKDFNSVSLNGEHFDLKNLKGKVVVLTFWSTRCPICWKAIPKLNKMVEEYKGKNVVFLAPASENSEQISTFLKKMRFNYEILPNSFDMVLKYGDKDGRGFVELGFPTHFLINQNGRIELRVNGFQKMGDLTSRIDRLLDSA